jgi:uncharacterized protein (TIGR02266 family)
VNERRAHQRKLVSTGVAFHDLDGAPLRGWLHDISRGGCFIGTPSLFTFGEELAIDLTLPYPRQRVHGKARVVWMRETNDKDMPAGMGMAFVDVNEDALVAIDKLAAGNKLSRPKTVIGLAPPAAGSSPSYSDVQIPLPKIEPEPAAQPDPIAIAAPLADPIPIALPERPKKGGREKWLIAGAAAISVGGLVTLGVVYARHGKTTPVVDAAASVAPSVTPIAIAIADAEASSVAVTPPPPPPPIVDAGADGGKKKPPPKKIKRR